MLRQILIKSIPLLVIGLSTPAFAKVLTANPCVNLKDALTALETNLKSEASINVLEGTMTREYRAAYKSGLASIAADPSVAKQLAEKLSNPTFVLHQDPSELLLTMDVLAKASADPKVGLQPFVSAAQGLSKAFREVPKASSIENLDKLHAQLGSRVINALDFADRRDALKLFRIIEADEVIRGRFVVQNNAPLSMLKALKKIAPTDDPGPEVAAQLYSARIVANAWIKPQLKLALSPQSVEAISGGPHADWALARVLANEMKRLLKKGDPDAAARYEDVDRKLALNPNAASYMTDSRVQEWFKTYDIPH